MTIQEAKELQEVKSRAESNTHQIDELKERVSQVEHKQDVMYQMSENLALLAQSMKNVESDVSDVKGNVNDLSNKVSVLENKPAQNLFTNVVKIKVAVITTICTAIGAGLLWVIIAALNK